MKKNNLFFILFYIPFTVIAQINIKVYKCYYDGVSIKLSIIVANNSSRTKVLEVDSIQEVEPLMIPAGSKQLGYAINNPFPNDFVLMFYEDSLVWNEIFSSNHYCLPVSKEVSISTKSYVIRDFEVVDLGEEIETLLNYRKDIYLQFFMVYKINNVRDCVMTKKVKVSYYL